MTTYSKFCIYLFCILFAVTNLHPFHFHPFRMYFQDLAVIIGLLFLASTYELSFRLRSGGPYIVVVPILVISFITLSSVGQKSDNCLDNYIPLAYCLFFIACLIIGADLAKRRGGADYFCRLFAAATIAASLASVAMQFTQIFSWDLRPLVMYMPKTQQLARPFANVAQPNQLALLYCMSLAALYWWQQTRKLHGLILLLMAWWIIAGLVMTQSRIAWLILPLMAILIALRELRNPRLLFGLALILLSYVLMLSQLDALADYLGHSGALAERLEGRSERKILWLQALRMAFEHPWLGVGWGGFGPAQVAMAADFTPSIYSEHAHNLVLNLAAEIGIPATLLICGLLGYWAWAVLPRVWAQSEGRFLALCLLAVAVHSMVEFPLWYAYILLPVGLMMGILHQLRWPAPTTPVCRQRSVWPGYLVLLLASIAICWTTYDYWRVVQGFRAYQARTTVQGISTQALQQPAWTLFPQFYRYFELLDFQPRAGLTQAQLDELAFWTRRFGFVHTLNTLAETYVVNDQIPAARRTMLTLFSLHPWRYAEYYDYWQARAAQEPRFAEALQGLPARDAAQ